MSGEIHDFQRSKVSQGKTFALNRCGGKVKPPLVTYNLSNKAKLL